MYKVLDKHHGEMIATKNNGDIQHFKTFAEAWAYVTDPIDVELLGEVELIELHGAPPGRQVQDVYSLDEKDLIARDLFQRVPFKGD